jgi:hypothetical protein
VLGKRPYYA